MNPYYALAQRQALRDQTLLHKLLATLDELLPSDHAYAEIRRGTWLRMAFTSPSPNYYANGRSFYFQDSQS